MSEVFTEAGTVRAGAERRALGFPAALTTGFGTTVAMWAVGYFCRLPAVMLPSPLLLLLLLGCLFAGGYVLGRLTRSGWIGGALNGLVAAAINLLVLGSLITGDEPNRLVPSAVWWLPGSVAASALLSAVGAELGARRADDAPATVRWVNGFAWVAVCATALLLAAGGLVTSAEAGLAVDDWPTSFGYNMFLYPFSKMTGGIYYEHAHRLLGALVGLTTLVLAFLVKFADPRRWVRLWAGVAVPIVILQGLLGGIRVTDRNLALAMTHGVLAQVFFAGLVALAVFTSDRWMGRPRLSVRLGANTDRILGPVLLGLTVVQLVLGASQRHFQALLIGHLTVGLAVVVPLGLYLGARAWGLNRDQRQLQRLGRLLLIVLVVQVTLGFAALVVTMAGGAGLLGRSWDLVFTTAHQWFGAVLLATITGLVCWNARCLREPETGA